MDFYAKVKLWFYERLVIRYNIRSTEIVVECCFNLIVNATFVLIRDMTHCLMEATMTPVMTQVKWAWDSGTWNIFHWKCICARQGHNFDWLTNKRKPGVELLIYLHGYIRQKPLILIDPRMILRSRGLSVLSFDAYDTRSLVKCFYLLASQGNAIGVCIPLKAGVEKAELRSNWSRR